MSSALDTHATGVLSPSSCPLPEVQQILLPKKSHLTVTVCYNEEQLRPGQESEDGGPPGLGLRLGLVDVPLKTVQLPVNCFSNLINQVLTGHHDLCAELADRASHLSIIMLQTQLSSPGLSPEKGRR